MGKGLTTKVLSLIVCPFTGFPAETEELSMNLDLKKKRNLPKEMKPSKPSNLNS